MKKLIILAAAVCLVLVLTGCTRSQSTESEHVMAERSTLPDTTGPSMSLPALSIPTYTDILTTTDQKCNISEAADSFQYDAHIGDSIFPIRQQCEDIMLFLRSSCCIWKDLKGYCIVCNDKDSNQVFAVVRFSDDLKLIEADGLKPIEAIHQPEEWIGKTLDEFIAQYGQYHVDFGSGFFYPAYISEIGTVYWMNVQYDYESDIHHMITEFHSFSLKDLDNQGK